jgi:hypothetical protein
MARNVLGDVWRVSELAEDTVHTLSALYGEELGRSPTNHIYVNARLMAAVVLKAAARLAVSLG